MNHTFKNNSQISVFATEGEILCFALQSYTTFVKAFYTLVSTSSCGIRDTMLLMMKDDMCGAEISDEVVDR